LRHEEEDIENYDDDQLGNDHPKQTTNTNPNPNLEDSFNSLLDHNNNNDSEDHSGCDVCQVAKFNGLMDSRCSFATPRAQDIRKHLQDNIDNSNTKAPFEMLSKDDL